MITYRITSKQGIELGEYRAATAAGALDALARDAGYACYGDVPPECGCGTSWTEDAAAFHRGAWHLLVQAV